MWIRRAIRSAGLFAVLVSWTIVSPTVAEQVETVAGTGKPENNGDSGRADQINIGQPFGVEIGPDGGLYITEVQNHRVLRLDLKTKQLTTVAGCGRKGFSGDGGPATKAELNEPYEVRFDRQGNMYFVEMQNHIVRRVDAKTQTISTVAGMGKAGYEGDGGPATKALFRQPHSIVLDDQGKLYIADIGNHRIRCVDLTTGLIESIAGNGEKTLPVDGQICAGKPVLGPRALFIDGDAMWVALREGHSVWRLGIQERKWHFLAGTGKKGYSGDGGPGKLAAFNGPKGIAVGPDSRVYVVDTENNAIRRIDSRSGHVATILNNSASADAAAGDSASQVQMNRPHGICVASDGSVYITDTLNHRVLRWSASERGK